MHVQTPLWPPLLTCPRAAAVEADSSVEWWAEQRPSSVRSWQLPSRPVTADSIIHHRIHNDRGDPRKVGIGAN